MDSPSPSPAVSSSSTLWATASKDWVLPAKPKPGRKPKKDPQPAAVDEIEVDTKGKRVQNRAAQRAFRERKQSQLADLQARIQMYEQGEIERNVALQTIAKRLKEENESLRAENKVLKEKIAKCEAEHSQKKRWRDDSPSNFSTLSSEASAPKRAKTTASKSLDFGFPFYGSSPPSMVSSPASAARSFSPANAEPTPSTFLPQVSAPIDINSYQQHPSIEGLGRSNGIPFNCGFCVDDGNCVCREFGFNPEHFNAVSAVMTQQNKLKIEQPMCVDIPPADQSPAQISILDNLPAYQPPVPLRSRRTAPSTQGTAVSIYPIKASVASCSGDPSNCAACADDSFGKAFCTAIGASVSSSGPCDNCDCGKIASPSAHHAATSRSTDGPKIPTDDAWRQLKSHPNAAFADLSLLAEVVARRSKCSGPEVVISPALGSITPERVASPCKDRVPDNAEDGVLLTDPHAHYHERQRTRSVEGSDGAHSPCGTSNRVREVHAEGVKDALRLLDSQFTPA